MKGKTKILLGSALSIAMCASLIAGSTFALFTSKDKVNIAITSGKVDVEASITDFYTYSNAEENIPVADIVEWEKADSTGTGFTGTFENLGTVTYAADDGAGTLSFTNISPGDAVKFTVSIVNKSSIAVKYQVRIAVGAEETTNPGHDEFPDYKLSSVLELTFNKETVIGFDQAATAWSDILTPAASSVPATQEVILRLPKDVGDEYQSKSCAILLSVVAVQGNGSVTSYCESRGEHHYDLKTNKCIYCGAENPIKGHYDEDSGTFVLESLADPEATDVEIPGTMGGAPVSIKDGAFQSSPYLESVTLGEGITEIGDNAFNDCRELTDVTLPESLTSIGDNAFDNCIELRSVEIPDKVESLGASAFQNCHMLENVTLGDGITAIGENTFFGCGALTSITFGNGLTEIGEHAFSGCRGLTTVDLPESLTTIGSSAFSDSGLTTIDLSKCTNLTTIGESAFSYTALTEVSIPDNVTELGRSAFAHSKSLQNVTLGTGITAINNGVFYGCTSLTTITINGHLKSIKGNPFYDCTSDFEITYVGDSTEWKKVANDPYSGTWSGCTGTVKIHCQGDGVTLDKDGEVV